MKLFDKKSIIRIEEEDLRDAKLSSLDFSDENIRKRVFVDVLGARLAMKMLFSQKIEANNLYSLYTIQNVLEDIDIADIYFKGIKIDVRLIFNRDEIFIPKSHFDLGLLPDLYLVMQLSEDVSCAEFLGFFEPKTLNVQNENKDFYFYEYEKLKDPKIFKAFLNDFIVENKSESAPSLENTEELFISLVDKDISQKDKYALFKQLAQDIALREKMVEFENFERISKKAASDDSLFQDGVLDIVGAQRLFEDEAAMASQAEYKAEVIEEVLSDLLEVNDNSIDLEPEDVFAKEDLDDTPFNDEPENESSEEIENEEAKTAKNTSGDFPTGAIIGGAAIAGAAIAGAAAAGAAAAAASGVELQKDLALNTADALSEGIEAASELMQEGLKSSFVEDILENEAVNVGADKSEEEFKFNDAEFENEFIQEELNDTEEEFENEFVRKEADDNELIENEVELPEQKIENEPEIIFEDEINSEDEIPQENPNNNEEGFDVIQDLKEEGLLGELPKLEGINSEENLDDYQIIEEDGSDSFENEINTGKPYKEVINLDDFDFDMLNETVETPHYLEDAVVPFDEIDKQNEEIIKPQTPLEKVVQDSETDSLDRFRELEEEDEEVEEVEETPLQDNTDEFISQVDEFLKDIEISDEKKELLNNTLIQDNLEESLIENLALRAEKTYSEEMLPDNFEQEIIEENNIENSNNDLKFLFNEEKKDDIPNLDIKEDKKILPKLNNKKMVLAASVASVVLVSFVIGANINNNKNNPNFPTNAPPMTAQGQNPADLPQNDTSNLDMLQQTPDQTADPLAQAPAPSGDQSSQVNRDMGKAVSDAFLSEPVNATISKVAWEVPEDLAYNDNFRKYLQIAGKNMKLNLQNNLLLATEMAYSNKVVVDLTISRDGSLQAQNLVTSSGSKQIDKIVLQSVKETLKYLKMPSSELSGNSVSATLIINF